MRTSKSSAVKLICQTNVAFFYFLVCTLLLSGCNFSKTSTQISKNDPDVIHRLNNQLSETIILDGFPPPVASRILAYVNIAGYEAAIAADTNFFSYKNQLNGFTETVVLREKENYVPEIAVVRAYCRTAVYFTYRDYMMDTVEFQLLNELKSHYSKNQFSQSVSYGDSVAAAVIKWASQDRYNETRKMPFHVIKKKDWSWELTPPQFMEAIEPYWGLIRPFVMDSAAQFRSPGPPQFSKEKKSEFYKAAMLVMDTKGKLLMNDTASANFWDCNPFVLKREGHLSYYKRQISPGAHWIGIAQIACKLRKTGLKESCEIYSRTAISLADAFIAAWETKYRFSLLRPVTYINRYIDPQWRPLLETPPFPEYISAHSTISTAAALVLEDYFGKDFTYTDSVEITFEKAPRKFNSFRQASNEAALSRLYGGIHYLFSIEDGKRQGESIGALVLQRLKTSKK